MDEEELKKYNQKLDQKLGSYLFNEFAASKIKPSPLKPFEVAAKEEKAKVEEKVKNWKEETQAAWKLLRSKLQGEEELEKFKHITQVLTKMVQDAVEGNADKNFRLQVEDFDFLNGVADRELVAGNFSDASKLFAFIVQMNPSYSFAWLGWAISEKKLDNSENVEKICEAGILVLPTDFFICAFAAEFYSQTKRAAKAIEILQQALTGLEQSNRQDGETYRDLKVVLTRLEGVKV